MAEQLDSQVYSKTSFPTSTHSSLGDNSYHRREHVEGYDYEFVPAPDSKYECVICLLVLREPQQTKCGHRFCKACITKWLRESNKTCPVDNERIVESDLFSDNFAKREIKNFKVRCPNKGEGCDKVDILSLIQKHVEECPFAPVPCQNSCPDILLRKDLSFHLSYVCCYRNVVCQYCKQSTRFIDSSKHIESCPELHVTCTNCGMELTRRMRQHHESYDCEKAIVACSFQQLGCLVKMERANTDAHMNSTLNDHLKMLCSEVIQISRHLGLPTGHNYSGAGETVSSMHATQMSEELLSRIAPGFSQMSLTSDSSRPSDQSEVLKLSMEAPPHSLTSTVEVQESYSSKPFSMEGLQGGQGLANISTINSPNIIEKDFSSLRQQNSLQDESLARHNQNIFELNGKVKELEKSNRDFKHKLRVLENIVDEKDGRACNGIYMWKIKDYNKLKCDAQLGNTPAIHSAPFYSSFYGYKLCIRVNLNGVDSAKGCFLSVFIHFLQGDYDDIMDWPFAGRIILSVMDQNTVCEYRSHISETLVAKPNLAAFQKPTTQRNHKGFGYMEFVPLSVLEQGQFVKNDTLMIKAHVIPNG